MKLSVSERIGLSGILPEKGSALNLKLVNKLREELSFSEKEHKVLQFKSTPNGGVHWTVPDKPVEKDIKFGEVVTKLIKEKLISLDKEEQIDNTLLPLYEKFVGEEESES